MTCSGAVSVIRVNPRKSLNQTTAGNAPGLNDGGAALVVASLAYAKANGIKPLARITGYATGGGEPKELFFAPILAVQHLMKQTGTSIGDYDLIEANEAFAVQAIADGRGLGWDFERLPCSRTVPRAARAQTRDQCGRVWCRPGSLTQLPNRPGLMRACFGNVSGRLGMPRAAWLLTSRRK